jgi:lysophospholipase L1-like esterase
MHAAHTHPSSSTKLTRIAQTAFCASFATAVLAAPSPAGAAVTSHSGTCAEPGGRTFKVDYTYDSQSAFVRATNILVRNAGGSTFVPFNDSTTLMSKMEWWSPNTFNAFLNPTPEGYSFAFVTLALDQAGYDNWWGAQDGRANILAQPVYAFLNPRIEFRSANDPLKRGLDSCDIYLGTYTAGSGTSAPRVAHIGDSISDQMMPKLSQLNFNAGRQYFIDPQSGQSYQTMIGEGRGIAAGIRDATGVPKRPDVLVIALGTNDVGGVSGDFNSWKTGLSWILSRMLIDTANIPCRVLMTVRDSGRDQGQDPPKSDGSPGASWSNPTLAAAADAYNQMIRDFVANNPTAFRLVDWNQMASTHRPGTTAEWFSLNPFAPTFYDRTHPNTAGLDALSSAIIQAENSCLGQ